MVVHPDVMFAGQYSHIAFLLVDGEHRRRGIGSRLVEEAIERAKQLGDDQIHADTTEKEAEELFRREGFKDDGVMLAREL